MLYMFVKFAFFSGEINYKFIPLIAFALFLILLDGWLLQYLWQPIWGKLILDDKKITWKCIFYPKVQIEYANIKLLAVRNFGSRNKVRCKKGIIKWAKSEAVYQALREAVPNKYINNLK